MDARAQVSTLTSLAMLKVNLDLRERDYIDYLVPFVSHVLRTRPPDPITDALVRDSVRDLFGLKIPTRGVQLVLRRLAKRNLLRLEHGIFHVAAAIPATDIPARQAAADAQIRDVVQALIAHAKTQFSRDLATEEATAALIRFVSRFSIECLRTFEQGTALPAVPPKTPGDLHLVSSFVRNARDTDTPRFEGILLIVKGHMLANALICPDLESLQRKFDDVVFYFDTPVVLRALHLQSESEFESTIDLLDLLKSLKARIAVFEHTAEEVHRVILWAEENIENPHANSRIVTAIRRQKRTRSDLALARARLNDSLRELGLERRPTPQYDAAFQIDERILEKALDLDVGYANPRALEYDVNSVRSIYSIRRGKSPFRLEDALAVLVTSNNVFAHAAFEYGKNHASTRAVSSVITDYSLANVAWLKAPLGAPSLPARELMAMCYAALEPGRELWSAYMIEIDKLQEVGRISARDHELLRSSLRARDELMNLTMGDEAALTGRTVTDILERIKAEIVSEKNQELEAAKSAHGTTATERDRLAAEQEKVYRRIHWASERSAGWIARVLVLVGVAVLIVSGLLSPFATTAFVRDSFILTGVFNAALLVGAVWSVASTWFGWSMRDGVRYIQRAVQRKMFGLALSALHLPEPQRGSQPDDQ